MNDERNSRSSANEEPGPVQSALASAMAAVTLGLALAAVVFAPEAMREVAVGSPMAVSLSSTDLAFEPMPGSQPSYGAA